MLKDPPHACEMCKKVEDLRPFGPQGEWVCFACGIQDKEVADIVKSLRERGAYTHHK